jgi:hypothetical protein
MIKVPAYQPVGLKDPNDEHVVAAAKAGEVDYLVTNDVTLLGEDLNQLDLLSTKPDDLLMALVKSSSKSLIQSVRDHISNLPKSKPSLDIYIQSLRKAGLVQFGSWLEKKKTTNKLFPEVW